MDDAFPVLFDRILRERRVTVRRFAALVGVTWSFVHQVRKGACNLPLDKVEPWADALGLTGCTRHQFLEAAKWSHIPAELRPWLANKMTPRDQVG